MLTERVAAFIERERLLAPGQKVVVGVSGGPDSLCLLHSLTVLGYAPLAAHLDHRLRRGSWRDAQAVLRTARSLGVPSVVQRLPAGELRRTGGSLEEAARIARYRFLVREARRWGAHAVATGHTADDQAETVVMHFLRGAGVSGLRGMKPETALENWTSLSDARGITLVRPLLCARRVETAAYCKEVGLRARDDPSNSDTAFRRNRIRHELMPILETYNPGIVDVLGRTAQVMREESEATERLVGDAAARALSPVTDESLLIRREPFLREPLTVQAGILALAARRLRSELRDFGFEAIEAARGHLADRRRGKRTQLPGGLELIDEGTHVRLIRTGGSLVGPAWPQLESDSPERLAIPGAIRLGAGDLLSAGDPQMPPAALGRTVAHGLEVVAWVDAGALAGELTVRPPRPGDRIRPLGMRGHRKIADVFNGLKIPAVARPRWPVVWSGERVVWLAGLRLGDEFRLGPSTRRAVPLRLERREDGGA